MPPLLRGRPPSLRGDAVRQGGGGPLAVGGQFIMKLMGSKSRDFAGTPYAMKVARTVWSRGKVGDDIKHLPIAIITI